VYDAGLLPHFIEYYRGLGVEAFAISICEQLPGIWAECERWAALLGPGIDLRPASAWQQRTGVEGAYLEHLRKQVASPEDWLIPADLDEFIQFPAPVPQLIEAMQREGADYLAGRFTDRIALDGHLIPATQAPTLWAQYPLECDFTARLVRGLCTKVALCRGNCSIAAGHHFLNGPARVLPGRRATVHHFKWKAGVIAALQRRVEIHRRQRVSWIGEAERTLAYFTEHGRIVPEQFGARPGWRPE
jgi:hypothetical protein